MRYLFAILFIVVLAAPAWADEITIPCDSKSFKVTYENKIAGTSPMIACGGYCVRIYNLRERGVEDARLVVYIYDNSGKQVGKWFESIPSMAGKSKKTYADLYLDAFSSIKAEVSFSEPR